MNPTRRWARQHTVLARFAVCWILAIATCAGGSPASLAAVTFSTLHGATSTAFDGMISDSDLIQGRGTLDVDVFENPSDSFGNPSIGVDSWHPANTDPLDHLPAFTDGAGIRSTNLTGLMNDNFPVEAASGRPAKIVQYPLGGAVDIGRIHIVTGNQNNADGRIFSTSYIEYSTDNGFTFQPLGYFQSDPSGTLNHQELPIEEQHKSTFLSIFDDSSATMLSGVTDLIFNLYSVDNTGGQMRDPFDGVNPFTGLDDGFSVAFVSPLVFEIDVLPPTEGLDGDFNSDGTVDAADYVVWRKNGGTPIEYDQWRANFGASLGSGAGRDGSTAVPEPGIMLTIGWLVVTAAGFRARNSR